MALTSKTILSRARACIRLEGEALTATAKGLGAEFVKTASVVDSVVTKGGKLIFSGVGKSAHIAQKLAGTFNSTGATSTFLDATQALHGDLGLCNEGDIAFLLSNSGQTEEVLKLIPMLKRAGVSLIAFTGNPESDLAKNSDYFLLYQANREACPLALAPTASTTAAMALGDALAMVLLKSRGVTRDDFARNHPGGNIGALLVKVVDLMRTGDAAPIMRDTGATQDAILAMTKAKCGCIALINSRSGKLTGIFTDGDLRRSALKDSDFLKKPVSALMTRKPKTIRSDALAVEALDIFEKHKIDDLIVVDSKGKPVGIVDGQDLPKLKIV